MKSFTLVMLSVLTFISMLYGLSFMPETIGVDIEKTQRQALSFDIKNLSTAVLLNFRAYDTFLEIGVLALTLFGMIHLSGDQKEMSILSKTSHHPILIPLTIIICPLMFIIGAYLLWSGTTYTGGAFQAGAIWASAGILMVKIGLIDNIRATNKLLIFTALLSFLSFIIVGVMFYEKFTYGVIFFLELTIMISTGITLVFIYALSRMMMTKRGHD